LRRLLTADHAKSQPSNTVKDPDDLTTGDETLKTLCGEAGEEFDPTLIKAQASKRIDELQAQTAEAQRTKSASREPRMAKSPSKHEDAEDDSEGTAITHPEEIRLEAQLTIRGHPTARAALRTTPPGVICAGLAVAAIILSSAAVARIVGRR
jgi:hypothetical protein